MKVVSWSVSVRPRSSIQSSAVTVWSTVAPLIRLGYGRMVWMALPYFVVMTSVGYVAVVWLL